MCCRYMYNCFDITLLLTLVKGIYNHYQDRKSTSSGLHSLAMADTSTCRIAQPTPFRRASTIKEGDVVLRPDRVVLLLKEMIEE